MEENRRASVRRRGAMETRKNYEQGELLLRDPMEPGFGMRKGPGRNNRHA